MNFALSQTAKSKSPAFGKGSHLVTSRCNTSLPNQGAESEEDPEWCFSGASTDIACLGLAGAASVLASKPEVELTPEEKRKAELMEEASSRCIARSHRCEQGGKGRRKSAPAEFSQKEALDASVAAPAVAALSLDGCGNLRPPPVQTGTALVLPRRRSIMCGETIRENSPLGQLTWSKQDGQGTRGRMRRCSLLRKQSSTVSEGEPATSPQTPTTPDAASPADSVRSPDSPLLAKNFPRRQPASQPPSSKSADSESSSNLTLDGAAHHGLCGRRMAFSAADAAKMTKPPCAPPGAAMGSVSTLIRAIGGSSSLTHRGSSDGTSGWQC